MDQRLDHGKKFIMIRQAAPTVSWPWEFVELAGVMLLALDRGGRVLHINARGAEILGRPVDEIVGRDWHAEFVPERCRDEVRRVFAQVIAGEADAPDTYENPVLCPDGSERIIAWRNARVRDPETGVLVAGISSGEDVTDLRRAEAELRESEARFRATFEQAAVGMAHVGFDGRFLRINDTLCAITGYDRAELERLTFADITHPDDLGADLAQAEALRSGEIPSYRLEKRYIRKDGAEVWVSLTGSVVRNATGAPQHFLAVVEDIGARKAAEALQASEELQRLALNAANAGAWHWDGQTDALTWSPEVFQLFGLGPSDRAPDFRYWLEHWVHPEDRHLFEAVLRKAEEEGGSTFAIEFRATVAAQGQRWISSTGRVICDQAHRPIRAYGLLADITSRRRLETTLRESEERLRLALAAGNIGAWDWDIAADRVTWSETFLPAAAPSGAAPDTVSQWLERVHPEDRPRAAAAIRQALAGEADYDLDLRLIGESGQILWLRTRGTVLRDPAGRPERMIGVDIDMTADKAAEEELRRLTRELDHRTRNAFALVQAIVSQTLSPGRGRSTLLDRLSALLRAQAIAARGEESHLALLVSQELAPYPPERVWIRGPEIMLSSRATTSLAMVLHELASNAAKYGALAGEAGQLSVEWTVAHGDDGEPLLRIDWTEAAGREIAPPTRQGFGSRLIKGSVTSTLNGTVDVRCRPSGLVANLTIPLKNLAP
jgi:PAS domain S-box-containing protein